jgi:hypothetical protein
MCRPRQQRAGWRSLSVTGEVSSGVDVARASIPLGVRHLPAGRRAGREIPGAAEDRLGHDWDRRDSPSSHQFEPAAARSVT